jgi:hypothetical protein
MTTLDITDSELVENKEAMGSFNSMCGPGFAELERHNATIKRAEAQARIASIKAKRLASELSFELSKDTSLAARLPAPRMHA